MSRRIPTSDLSMKVGAMLVAEKWLGIGSIKNHQLAPSKVDWMKKVNIETPEVNLPFPSNTKK